MKVFLAILVTAIIAAVTAERTTHSLTTQWSAITLLDEFGIGISAKNDLLVYADASDPAMPITTVARRNADGVYVLVANFTEAATTSTDTNGKWIMVADPVSDNVALFTIDDNNNISNISNLLSYGGFLLSDDTFVGYYPAQDNNGNYQIRSYQYEASNNTWINIPGAEVALRTDATYFGDASTYRATDTHLVFLDYETDPSNFTVNIYERQADRSWKFVDSVPVNSTTDIVPGSVSFNGETLVFSRFGAVVGPQGFGEVHIHTKTNNGWTEQTFDLITLGYHPLGLLGYTVVFVDADIMLLSVAFDGYTGNVTIPGGKVLVLTRENGVWKDSLDLVGDTGIFGVGLAINDHDVIAAAITSILGANQDLIGVNFLTAPLSATGFKPPVAAPVTDMTPGSAMVPVAAAAPVAKVQGTPSKVSVAITIQLSLVLFSAILGLVHSLL